MSQLGGGIGTRGPGETQLETDRRKIHRRIRHIREQLEEVRRIRAQQRSRRLAVPVPTVALVGYTNAGKSTLFNALTQAEVLASPRMFATLDPTLRSIALPSRRKALLSDTVGFIRDLPHTLVTSFRATLEEVQRASLILHVSDIASPMQQEQKTQVNEVLKELEVLSKPTLQVMNKIDLLSSEQRAPLANTEDIVYVSATKRLGLEGLLLKIDELLQEDPVRTATLRVPQSEGKALALIDAGAVVSARSYRGGNVHLQVKAPASLLRRVHEFVVAEKAEQGHITKI
jgi:GTP-binding protein HflX